MSRKPSKNNDPTPPQPDLGLGDSQQPLEDNSKEKYKDKEDIEIIEAERIADLAKIITEGWQEGRMPLFLFGARGTPTIINEYTISKVIIEEWEKENKCEYAGTEVPPPEVSPPSRPVQARFFSDLRKWDNGAVWKKFCESFLTDWVDKFFAEKKTRKESDELYGFISDCFQNSMTRTGIAPDILVLTTNFDGAIPEYLKENAGKGSHNCLVLDDPLRIRQISRLGTRQLPDTVKYVITLRGDVYHAVCNNPLCSVGSTKVSAYEALSDAIRESIPNKRPPMLDGKEDSDVDVKEIVDKILTCPECGQSRELTISFPGLEVKEQEIIDLMNVIWETFGTRISVICTVGFSGNSDREVVNSLIRMAKRVKCTWFDFGRISSAAAENTSVFSVKHLEQQCLGKTAVREYVPKHLGENRFFEIDNKIGAQGSLPLLRSTVQKMTSLPPTSDINKLNMTITDRLESDLVWIDKNDDLSMWVSNNETDKSSKNNGPIEVTLRKRMPAFLADYADKIGAANEQFINMHGTSQLSLKDYWWHPGNSSGVDISLHSRLHHSLGVLRVADAWFYRLRQNTSGKSLIESDEQLLTLLHRAALFHDIGHVPFSHLIEEVFKELHWSLNGEDKYTHEELTKIRLSGLLSTTDEKCFPRVVRLIDGLTGIHWLDAIMNSPFDADKIDYIFRDQRWIGLGARTGSNHPWLGDFLSNQEVTPQGQILLHGNSAVAAYKLLAERAYLYDLLYYAPKVRLMERITRYILTTYFVVNVSTRLGKEICQNLRGLDTAKIEDVWLSNSFVKSMLSDGVDATKAKGVNAVEDKDHRELCLHFFADLRKYYEKKGDNKEDLAMTDLGAAKLAFSIGDIYNMIDKKFPISSSYGKPRTKIDDSNKFLVFLKNNIGKPHFEKLNELKIIAEIGAWACRALENNNKQDKYLGDLVRMCHLVLDPNFGQDSKFEESASAHGKWLDRVYENHCIAGPYVVHAPEANKQIHEAEDWLNSLSRDLEEVGRQLGYEYPGRFLLDVTGPLKVRSYPSARIMHGPKRIPFICEQFWVPAGDPQSWSLQSRASVPLSTVDFRQSVPHAYKIRILLIDPSGLLNGRDVMVDRFRMACKMRNIKLEEENNNGR